VTKDIGVARAVGCREAWAEYGTYASPEYRERLSIVSSNVITRRHAAHLFEKQSDVEKPRHRLSNYEQVLTLLD
jgi:hypothetical protein